MGNDQLGNFNPIELKHSSGSSVLIYEYGGHIASWKDMRGKEVLFMSPKALFQAGKAIRGGVPIVFPQFGKGALPSHGFARTSYWSRIRESMLDSGPSNLVLRLTDNEETFKIWPHKFVAELEISLSEALHIKFRVCNTGDAPLEFQNALHTYFAVTDISKSSISGLKGVLLKDFLKANAESTEGREEIVVSEATDRVYVNSPSVMRITDSGSAREIELTKTGFKDSVVWNPWKDGSAALPDLEASSYKNFVCVESGNIVSAIRLEPGETFEAEQGCKISYSA